MKFKLLLLGLAITLWSCGETSTGGSATEGVTENGFSYTLHTAEEGAKAEDGDYVYFHVQRRADENILSSTRDDASAPVPSMPYTKVPAPGQEQSPFPYIMGLMAVGDSLTINFPLDTIPKEQLPPELQEAAVMYLDVTVVDIVNKEAYEAKQKVEQEKAFAAQAEAMKEVPIIDALIKETLAKYKSGALDADMLVLPGGLKIHFHEKGTGATATTGQTVSTQYYGALMTDGSEFDNSFKRGQPIDFPVGQGRVIKGWDQAFLNIPEGSKATMFIPADLAYGERGSPPNIEPNAELMFYVELEKVQ